MNENKKTDSYRESVFLPQTEFPMRGNLPEKEPAILKNWQEMDLYSALRKQSKGRPKWILHWGPPYANGHAHMGHAFTKSLKDVVNKSWQMMGYDAPLVPGWDCHGLPIEWKIEEQYRKDGKNKDEVDPITFRAECRSFAQKWVEIQSAEFQRVGVCGDFDDPYLTMAYKSEARIAGEIHRFLLNGSLYRGVKPVMWSTVEKTALAEAEIEYHEYKSVTVWVKFPVVSGAHAALNGAHVVIWTTTPWTLPSNRAIAYGEFDYIALKVTETEEESKAQTGDVLVIAKDLLESFTAQSKITAYEEVATLTAQDLEGCICAHPLRGQGYEYDVPLYPGEFVTTESGTGFVHIAPGHGADDFYLGQQFGIEVTDNVSDDGKFRDHVPLFAGEEVYDQDGKLGGGNFAVIKALNEIGTLVAKANLKHEYPHSWRSKAPVIFRTTPQWFIALDDDNQIRTKALKAIEDTKWVPEKGEARIHAMVSQRPDWCVSRQRAWGVPIAVFVEKKSGEPLKDEAVLNRITEAFEQDGADAWWTRDAQEFLGDQYKADDYEQIFDIVDVWFESGSTHTFVVDDREELQEQQADLYLEGSDQHRGWFHSSLLEACGTKGHAPYKTVLTHGFVLDDKGYKMSKSLGNVVDPKNIMKQYGADILRLWAMTSDYAEDIRIGKDTLKNTSDLYRRIRNTFRFLLGSMHGLAQAELIAEDQYGSMPELEQLMLHKLYEMDMTVKESIEGYNFGHLANKLHIFCNNDLSALYFDIRKDRLYCDAPDSFERRACRTILFHIFNCLVRWLAPILCFTAEEAWSQRPAELFEDDVPSVHMLTFLDIPKAWQNTELAEKWEKVLAVRSCVIAALEPKRAEKVIGSSLEAAPIIYLSGDMQKALEGVDAAELCITSATTIKTEAAPDSCHREAGNPDIAVCFEKAEGAKCERCWKVEPEVGSGSQPDLCDRCGDIIENKKAA